MELCTFLEFLTVFFLNSFLTFSFHFLIAESVLGKSDAKLSFPCQSDIFTFQLVGIKMKTRLCFTVFFFTFFSFFSFFFLFF